MAASAQRGRKKPSASGRSSSQKKKSGSSSRRNAAQIQAQNAIVNEIILIGVFALTILLFLCNFGVIGVVGDKISRVMFGVFGLTAYALPVLAFVAIAFGISNQGNRAAAMKLAAGVVLFFVIGVVCALISQGSVSMAEYSLKDIYTDSADHRTGGGVIAGSLAWVLQHFLGLIGTVLFVLVLAIICTVIITERSFVNSVKNSGRYVYETARTDAILYRERSEKRREENQERYAKRQEEAEERSRRRLEEAAARRMEAEERRARRLQLKEEEQARQDAEQLLHAHKKVPGVMESTDLKRDLPKRTPEDMHEITLTEPPEERVEKRTVVPMEATGMDFDRINIHTMQQDFEEASVSETPSYMEEPAAEPDGGEPLNEDGYIDLPPWEEIPSPALEPVPDKAPDRTERLVVPEADVYRDMKEISFSPSSGQEQLAPDPAYKEAEYGEALREEAAEDFTAAVSRQIKEAPGRQRPRPAAVPRQSAAKTEVFSAGTAGQTNGAKTFCTADAAFYAEKEAKAKAARPPYQKPPLSLLSKIERKNNGDSVRELKETAMRLQETLQTFGVRVTITDISQGPAVTRYELQPEQGVKVSRILSLTDDIKLNLAATDIRIEAPIPGKAAIGIEVPNKENTAVGLRELLETKEFQEFSSKIAFAVGKDIAGKVVVSDIAKMPHMLIAGSTGSGKSVCINTLIMSILYKADPSEVKLILVDPKVVELSVYNGIPHLLIPVVTDPKKASAALQWGVAEMTDRYKKFADYNVRDLKGFNRKMEELKQKGETGLPEKMPQIVIIVDELADLMMVAPGEVEESICRLAQLARAAGIHLIIATQRPSVDVITGLIKANMPSRVAFAVSSGVDSRTILDMNGAEKLLGKGDMLFYPQGYSKPVRVQGAFVSDGEVSAVVDYLKNQNIGNVYSQDVEEKLKDMGASGASGSSGGSEYDAYFADAGRLIIDKDKASIGMLQRMFKIGFNRAARIMDQLADAGVVGEEEGTKPRKVLMGSEEFEQLLEEIV
ncbi:MAG: DNA translocase FtsK 4TM domain-containing protein [Firmicutes bacterium]|nr:DNA translocase FtsK 4TM domain-containing protein [Bacillota bacterium]